MGATHSAPIEMSLCKLLPTRCPSAYTPLGKDADIYPAIPHKIVKNVSAYLNEEGLVSLMPSDIQDLFQVNLKVLSSSGCFVGKFGLGP